MDFQNILLLAVTIINLIWGILILSQSKGKKENIFFSLVVFSVVSWSIAMMGYRWASNNYTLIWCRFLYVTAVLIPLFFLFFNYLFPKQKEGFKIQQAIFISLPAVALILLTIFSDTIIANAYRIPHQENKIIFGSLYLFYVAYIVGYFNWSFFHLITNYKKYTGVIKAQIRYIFLGAFMASFVAMATNLLLPWFNYFVFNWFGQFSTVLWVSFTSYAIIRYRLMDIRIIVRNVAVYFGISLIAYGFFYFLIWFYDNFFGGSYSLIAYAVGLIIAPVFVAILLSVYRLLLFVANKYLFSSLSSYQETMAKLIKELNYSIDLQKITDLIVNTIKQTMQLNRAGVLLLDKSQSPDLYRIAKVIGFNEQNGISLVRDNFLTKYLEKTKLPLVSDELILLARDAKSKKEQESFERLYEHMEHIEASLCLPLISNKKLIGIIVLGLKTSGDAYSKEDLELLDILANQASIAINNAQQYKEIQEFNGTLKQKVTEQTEDITKKSQYLQELLEMKSDFLRVVNHQLNTPLSIIKSAYSMVKEGTFSADKGFEYSSGGLQRLDDTVQDFWDAYELEGNKMKMNPAQTDIEQAVNELIKEKEKMQLAIERKIKVSVIKPTFKIPLAWCDPKKIVHVISNLLDNAVYYTREGSVTVSYELQGNNLLKVNVKDTGTGISDEDKKRLFQKFSRGVKSTNLHPDGSGLGLYIAKKIIEGNDGELTCFSEGVDKGATFSFTVPIYTNQKPVPEGEFDYITMDQNSIEFKHDIKDQTKVKVKVKAKK